MSKMNNGQQVRDLFDSALARPLEERARFLDRACVGDEALRREVESLLAADQGAIFPKAEVLILEERTGFSRTVVANDEGFYSAPSLPFGRYSVSTVPQGFKKTAGTTWSLWE